MASNHNTQIVKVMLLSGFCGGLWGAFLELFADATGSRLVPQLLNIVAMAAIGLYAITKMQAKVKTLENENIRIKEDNRRLRAEVKTFELMSNTSLPEWPEASENHPPHDAKTA